MSTILFVWGLFGNIRSDFISAADQEKWKLPVLFPQVRWYWLVIAFLILTLIAVMEGAYRTYRREFNKLSDEYESEIGKIKNQFAKDRDLLTEQKAEALKNSSLLEVRLESEKKELRSQFEFGKAELQTKLEAEKAELQSQLEAEKAKKTGSKIEGEIQEILINHLSATDGEKLGSFVTVKAYIINRGPHATRIRTFALRMTVNGKVYESKNFHTGGLYKAIRRGHPRTAITNLADVANLAVGLEYNLAQEGHLRFFIAGLVPPREPPTYDEGWIGGTLKAEIFNLEDVEDVALIVSDYSTK